MFTKLTKAIDRLTAAMQSRAQLECIESKLDKLLTQGDLLMSRSQELNDLIDALNINSNETAAEVARIRTVLEGIQAQLAKGLSEEATDAIKQRLEGAIGQTQAVEDELKALGTDPNNPIPE